MTNLEPRQYAGSQVGVDLPSYISGYFDGEGCFTVSISRRPKIRVGWEVRPGVSVSQNGDRSEVLLEVREYFGCGSIRPDRSDRTLKWEVRSVPVLIERVIPHFRKYPMRSGKQHDFEGLAKICELIEGRAHLEREGLRQIVTIAARMNPSGRRGYDPREILTDLEMKA